MDERDYRKIKEVSYLVADNAPRYRAILRYCYERHSHMQTFLYPEDIYQSLHAEELFKEYTFDQLEQDLRSLVEWGNLQAHQEIASAKTIDDFKKKRYRYQLTQPAIEVERMVETIKNLGDSFAGSLETTQFDRLLMYLESFLHGDAGQDDQELHQTWEDLMHYFTTMGRNTADYLAHIRSVRIEGSMQVERFLIYKDTFTKYLREFILGLQTASDRIRALLMPRDEVHEAQLFARLAAREMIIHGMEEKADPEKFAAGFSEDFRSMREWFCGKEGRRSELAILETVTKETIERITGFAERMVTQYQTIQSRKADYLYLAQEFARCRSKAEADSLAAAVFGAGHTRHLVVHEHRLTDKTNHRIEEEPADLVKLKPRTVHRRERSHTSVIRDYGEKKREALQAYRERQKETVATLESLMRDGVIDFSALPELTGDVRKTLLVWLDRCMSQEGGVSLPNGRIMRLDPSWRESWEKVCVKSEDGDFYMPPMRLLIAEETGGMEP